MTQSTDLPGVLGSLKEVFHARANKSTSQETIRPNIPTWRDVIANRMVRQMRAFVTPEAALLDGFKQSLSKRHKVVQWVQDHRGIKILIADSKTKFRPQHLKRLSVFLYTVPIHEGRRNGWCVKLDGTLLSCDKEPYSHVDEVSFPEFAIGQMITVAYENGEHPVCIFRFNENDGIERF